MRDGSGSRKSNLSSRQQSPAMSGGNPTVYTNAAGVTLQAFSGPVNLSGNSLTVNAGSATIQGPLSVSGALTVQGAASLNGAVTCSNLSLQTLGVSGNVTLQGPASMQAVTVQGPATLQSTLALSGALTGAGATLSGALTVAQAAQLQSTLQVGGNATLLGQLSVTGQATFGAQVTFASNVSFATNTSFTAYNQTVQNTLTVQSQAVASGTSTRPLVVQNTSTVASSAVEVYYDCTASSSSAYAQTTLTSGAAFVLSTAGKAALTTSLANQQTTVTAFRAGDTFRVKGDGTVSTTTELCLDNTAAQSAQIARVGCDSSGLYFSPGSATKAVNVDLTGKLNASRGGAILGGLSADTFTSPSVSAGSLAATTLSAGTLTSSSLTAAGSSVLALAGADVNKTVTAPALVSSSLTAAASAPLTLVGKDSNSSVVVQGRLQADVLTTNAASALTISPPVTLSSNLTGTQGAFQSLAVSGSVSLSGSGTNRLSILCNSGTQANLGIDFSTYATAPPGGSLNWTDDGQSSGWLSVMVKNQGSTTASQVERLRVSALAVTANLPVNATAGLSVTGSTTFAGAVTPSAPTTYDLGSSSAKWRTAYVGTSIVLPNATFTGKLSELSADILNLTGAMSINYNNVRGLTLKNASTTASSIADIFFDRSAVSSTQTGGIGMGGDTQGLFLATNGAQRVNISTSGLVGVGALPVSPLTLLASSTTQGYTSNGLYVYNPNTTSSSGSPQNATITTQVQALNSSANAFHCFDNTQASWSIGMRGADSKFFMSPSNTSAQASPKLTLDNGGNATFAGGLLVADGTAALPSYGFTTDTNTSTGFYHPGTSTIAATVGGARSMQWNSDKSVTAYGNLAVTQSITAAGANITGYSSLASLGVNQNAAVTGTLTVSGTTSTSDLAIASATTSNGMLRLAGTSSQQAEATMTFSRSGTGTTIWAMGQGTFSTSNDFAIGGGAGLGAVMQISSTSGYVTLRYGGTSTSDKRLKKDIAGLQDSQGLDFVKQLKPVEYRWKEGKSDKKHLGFLAQDVQEISGAESGLVQEAVHASRDPELSLAYTELIAPLVMAVQQLSAEVERLKQRV